MNIFIFTFLFSFSLYEIYCIENGDKSFVIERARDKRAAAIKKMPPPSPSPSPPQNQQLTIKNFQVLSEIQFRYSVTQISSRVINGRESDSEISFSVVLPETVFVSSFRMEIDGKMYKGIVKEKEDAKETYNEAKNRGESAGLVEVRSRNSNIFVVSVNIKKNAEITFHLSYEELLARTRGRLEHVINISPEQIIDVEEYGIMVSIVESAAILFVRVPKLKDEEIEIEETNDEAKIERVAWNRARVTWIPMDKSRFSKAKDSATLFSVQYDVQREYETGEILLMNGYFVHYFSPKNVAPLRKHVIYILDTSGSMMGRKIEQLRAAMTYVLDDLKPEDYFNIITFSDRVNVWTPESSKYENEAKGPIEVSETNLDLAHKHCKKIEAMGGTNIFEALTEGLNVAKRGQERSVLTKREIHPIIVFLTDGEPTVGLTNPSDITMKISSRDHEEKKVSIFSLAFGSGADFSFLKKLSLKNFGFARKIYEASDADLQLKGFYAEISSPLLTNVTFKYTNHDVEETSRKEFHDYFKGSEIAVCGKYKMKPKEEEEMNVIVTGKNRDWNAEYSNDKVKVMSIDRNYVSFPHVKWCPYVYRRPYWCHWPPPSPQPQTTTEKPREKEDYFLERLWAYLTIRQLLDAQEAQMSDTKDSKKNVNKRALDLALKYEFVTPLTSLVVVKPEQSYIVPIEPYYPSPQPQPYYANYASTPMKMNRRYHTSSVQGAPTGMYDKKDAGAPPADNSKASMQAEDDEEDMADVEAEFDDDVASSIKDQGKDKGKATTTPKPNNRTLMLNDITWLVRRSIIKDNVSYRVLEYGKDASSIRLACNVKGKKGLCMHLKDCIKKDFLNSKDTYFKSYFCSIRVNDEPSDVYAGSCCETK